MSDLLTFARVRELKRTEVDVASLLADLKASAKLDPAMRDVDIEIHGDANMTVECDVDQLRVVVTNLFINAAQAMSHAGRIDVSIAPLGHESWRLTVADHGPGIPTGLEERVFEPFFTTKHRGTGLGLPTAKRIVEAHGGELTLANGPEGGTVAQLVMPRHLA
jgi:two-component system sensor histidine kinase HydH